jgi:hypothetical protein
MDEEPRLSEFEEQARGKVSESISAIEVALSEWESAKAKPEPLAIRIRYLKMSHQMMSDWAKESLKGKTDASSVKARIKRFISMCRKLESMKGGSSG